MRKKITLEEMQKIASERGGECLSATYLNANTPLLWKCKRGHTWSTKASHIKAGTWCKRCRPIDNGGSLEDLQKIAQERGGKLLTKEYSGVRAKYLWKCGQNHEWETSGVCVKLLGCWCPLCSSGLGERICKEYLEQLFEAEFSKSKPSWLISEGKRLELDGYNSRLKIAFEHQGRQHYVKEPNVAFYSDVATTQKHDIIKAEICRENGVRLIIIPEIFSLTKLENLKTHLKLECIRLGIEIPNGFEEKEISLKEAYNPNRLKLLQQIAEEKGGELLSTAYLGNRTPLLWKCNKGHFWKTSPSHIISSKSWCPHCAVEVHPNTSFLLKTKEPIDKKGPV